MSVTRSPLESVEERHFISNDATYRIAIRYYANGKCSTTVSEAGGEVIDRDLVCVNRTEALIWAGIIIGARDDER